MKIEQYFDKQKKQKLWRVDVTVRGVRVRQGRFPSAKSARAFVFDLQNSRLRSAFGLPLETEPITIKKLMAELRANLKRSRQTRMLDLFEAAVDGHKSVELLSRKDLAAFKQSCEDAGLQPASIRNYRNELMAMLRRAGELFDELENWIPPRFPPLPRSEPRTRVLRPDELRAIFDQWRRPDCLPDENEQWRDCRLELCDIAQMMLLTASRREHIETILETNIDWSGGWATFRSNKIRSSHVVALNSQALAILRARSTRNPMFQTFADTVPHHVCRRVGLAAGIGYGRADKQGWTMHDLRRTAATWLESAGIPYSAVSGMLGHKRSDITAVYTLADRANLRRAADLLEQRWRDFDEASNEMAIQGGLKKVA